MTDIDLSRLAAEMLEAVSRALAKKTPELVEHCREALDAYLVEVAEIKRLQALGEIDEERARDHLALQKLALESALLVDEGLSTLAIEEAINAALDVARGPINAVLGWRVV